MQETSLLELFESALGRPRQSWHGLAERPLPEPDSETDLDFALCPIEVAEPEPLDTLPPQAALELLPALRERVASAGLFISVGLHVMPLAGLIAWGSAAPEITAPIPVQLVVEQPPPPPMKQEQKSPPSGPLASEDTGKMSSRPDVPVATPAPPPPPPAAPPPAPKETKLAEVPPPPPKPKPKPRVETAAVDPVLQPAPPAPPQPRPPARAPRSLDEVFSNATKDTGIPGPAATRDDYLAYLVTLTRRHIDLLPPAFVGGRRGETALAILVLGDGTIARIAVKDSSGYPDIDQRIEQMVTAVGRFPPLPQWYQQPAMDLTLRLRFPEAIEQ
ncbi:MAG TPA: energy transducer TonB [Stellaceae bacterium]|jgi:protein TonB|nr:energy transducer TonB [Stellaceae bacterium]